MKKGCMDGKSRLSDIHQDFLEFKTAQSACNLPDN